MKNLLKMSHSNHILNIQINTKSLVFDKSPSFQQHQIVLLCEPHEREFSNFHYVHFNVKKDDKNIDKKNILSPKITF